MLFLLEGLRQHRDKANPYLRLEITIILANLIPFPLIEISDSSTTFGAQVGSRVWTRAKNKVSCLANVNRLMRTNGVLASSRILCRGVPRIPHSPLSAAFGLCSRRACCLSVESSMESKLSWHVHADSGDSKINFVIDAGIIAWDRRAY